MKRPSIHRAFRFMALLLFTAIGTQAHAQDAPDRPATPSYALTDAEKAGRRTIDVVVYGDDACPTTDDGTIIVCARRPEAERFRIPKAIREREKAEAAQAAPAEQGWGSRAMATESAGRAFLPNSCSPIGTNGFTGCTQAMLQQWFAERRAAGKLRPLGGD